MKDLDNLMALIHEVRARGFKMHLIALNPFEYVSVWNAARELIPETRMKKDKDMDMPSAHMQICGVELDCNRDAASIEQCREANRKGEWPPALSKFYAGVPRRIRAFKEKDGVNG